MLLAIFSFFLAPVFWFYFNYKINHIFGYGNQFISRFNARSDFSLFIDPSFYIEFFDEFTNQAGPIGVLLLFLLFSNAGRIAKWEPAPLSAVVALSSLLLFTLVFFQSTFIECCPYLAYPIIALSSFGVMEINIDRSEASTVFVVMLLASFVGGASLHGVENNYTERELQEYVINEIESEDGLVVTDHQISRWNAYRWQIPGGTIHISADYSPNDFHDLISIVAPEHIILSNESFLSVEASSMGEKLGYCFEEIETDEQIPENWVEGWMSDIYPIRAGKRC